MYRKTPKMSMSVPENTEDEYECTGKVEIPKVEFMAVGTARKALFLPTTGTDTTGKGKERCRQ